MLQTIIRRRKRGDVDYELHDDHKFSPNPHFNKDHKQSTNLTIDSDNHSEKL